MTGRSVLVTGASRGLGRALALAFGRAGARLAVCSRDAAAVERVGGEIRDTGADCIVRSADVTDADAVAALVAEAESRWGALDVLVNNASVLGPRVPLRDHDPGDWRAALDVNLTGAWICCRAVLPGMRRAGRGSIINVTSGVGDEPRAGWGIYAVSKWALEGLTWNLALEEADRGIRVNAVNPGGMRTAMRRDAYPEEDPESVPAPAEVVNVFLWLASEEAVGVTGRRFEARGWERR